MSARPDIVFVTMDTLGRDACSAYVDRPCVETPHLERLAREGVLFENALTTCPLCTPARSTWFTGLHPSRSGAWSNNMTPHRDAPMLGETLTAAGYRAVHLGKWHLDGGGTHGRGCADGGFEDATWYDPANFLDEVGHDGPNRFGGWNRGLEAEEFCCAHRVVDRALEALQAPRDGDTPLFVAVELDEPHGPYICPPPYRGMHPYDALYRPPTMGAGLEGKPRLQQAYARFLRENRPRPDDLPRYYAKYYDCATYADAEVGRLLDGLERRDGRETVVVFTADHGDHLGAFGLCPKGPTMYDATVAVPLILRGPDLPAGRRVASVANGADVWATLLDYAGLDPDGFSRARGYEGKSLRSVAAGTEAQVRDDTMIEFNRFGVHQNQTDGLYPIRCLRTERWKLAINLLDTDELYDLAEDPDETRNRIDDPACAAIRGDLHDRLLATMDRTDDPFRGPAWLRRPWRPDRTHVFTGFFTTGWYDSWETEVFA